LTQESIRLLNVILKIGANKMGDSLLDRWLNTKIKEQSIKETKFSKLYLSNLWKMHDELPELQQQIKRLIENKMKEENQAVIEILKIFQNMSDGAKVSPAFADLIKSKEFFRLIHPEVWLKSHLNNLN
jgi:hypothetical protein